MVDGHKARDIALLDALDALPRESLSQSVWRVVREGRDPLQGSSTRGRWGSDTFETLYTSLENEGATAEIYALLSSQPVFPSRVFWDLHRISVEIENLLCLPALDDLAKLGVDPARYRLREYQRTQEIADAAIFLGFHGMLVPSARWPCNNLVIFTDRLAPSQLALDAAGPTRIDWNEWKARHAAKPRT